MVIAPGTKGITAHVCLADGEALPLQFNHEKVVVYRRGKSTDGELVLIKTLGVVLEPNDPILRDSSKPVCNFSDEDRADGPIHEHENGDWYFYEENWIYESGPYKDYDEAYQALAEYCLALEMAKNVYIEMSNEAMENDTQTENEGDGTDVPSVDSGSDGDSSEVADGVED